MDQDTAAASRPGPAHTQLHEKGLILRPDLDGFYRCNKCKKPYLCSEPYMFHEQTCNYADLRSAVPTLHDELSTNKTCTSGDTTEHVHVDLKRVTVPEPYVRICRGVWCGDGTHYVQVNVSQSLGPDSTIQQVDEDKTFTVEGFSQMKFSHTEVYEDTIKKITELNKRCCRPVQDTSTARTPEYRSSNARTNSIKSSYNLVAKWLQSCFFACIPMQKGSSRWATTTCPSTPDLQPNSSCSSTEAIIADTRHRSMVATKYCEKSDMKYRKSTANPPTPTHTTSGQVSTQALCPDHFTTYKPSLHLAKTTDTFLTTSVIGVVAVESFYSTCEGVCGCGVLVLTRSDTITLLQGVNFGALIERERIAGQLRDILGESAYNGLLHFEQKRSCLRDPVYRGILPKALQIRVGGELPLEQFHPLFQAQVQSGLDL